MIHRRDATGRLCRQWHHANKTMKPNHTSIVSLKRTTGVLALVLTFVLAGCSSEIHLADTPNLYVAAGAADPFERVPEAWRTNQVRILYATDRVAEPTKDGRREFGYARSMAMEFGHVTVDMGKNLSWDQLVADSRSSQRSGDIPMKVSNVTMLGQFPESNRPPVIVDGQPEDPPEVRAAVVQITKTLHATLRESLSHTKRKEVFVYVHGYNNTFDSAAIRMATLWHFLGREGVPVIYTWPAGSGGILRGYNYDRESGEFTIFHLKEFLTALADCPEVEKVNIISHSRGTDVTVTALRELNLEHKSKVGGAGKRMKLGSLVLAAPDLDWEVFNQRVLAERLGGLVQNFTVYVSNNDKALALSDWLYQGGARLGRLMTTNVKPEWQETLKHLNHRAAIVDVKANTNFLGHAYFVESPEVLSDLILMLRDNRAPGAENGRPMQHREDGFWEIHNGYPNTSPEKK